MTVNIRQLLYKSGLFRMKENCQIRCKAVILATRSRVDPSLVVCPNPEPTTDCEATCPLGLVLRKYRFTLFYGCRPYEALVDSIKLKQDFLDIKSTGI